MANISNKAVQMPASAIRKLVPLADAAKKQGTKVYHLNLGQPDIKSPKCAIDAIKNFSLENVSYSHSAGLMELRKGLVEKYYNKIGIDITVDELIVTVAGSESVNLALEIACNPGDEVIVLEPFYTNYNTFAFMNGLTLKAIQTDIRNGFQIPDIEEFESSYVTLVTLQEPSTQRKACSLLEKSHESMTSSFFQMKYTASSATQMSLTSPQ